MRLRTAVVFMMAMACASCGGALSEMASDGQCGGDFGASASAQKLEAFSASASAFTGSANELQAELKTACKDMAGELDIPDADLKPKGDEPKVKAICGAVTTKLRAEIRALRAQGNLRLKVVAEPPRCEVSLDAYADCAAECEADIEPGEVEIDCQGGELVGECSATCEGECSVEVDGQCEGECEGTCSGGCSGRCQGECEGQCSAQGADGQCNGRCDGTCHGTCSAGCQGSCEGQCWVSGRASCDGECRGGCSVEYEEPRCTGKAKPPQMSAECKASCDAQVDAKAKCTKGEARVVVEGDASGEMKARVENVKAALEGSWGAVLHTKAKLEKLAVSAKRMGRLAANVPGAVKGMGMAATACATSLAAKVPEAAASVTVSVEVSASLSASAG